MDLMGDIGAADQLLSAREEIKVLKAKVDELKEKVKELTLTNAQLSAEVELSRKSTAGLPSFSNLALGGGGTSSSTNTDEAGNTNLADFVSSGNGSYPSDPAVSLPNLHGFSNPLCCALDHSDTILATGGADRFVSILPWGSALAPGDDVARQTVENAARVQCAAPVICIRFSVDGMSSNCGGCGILAAGCMDASVHLIGYKMEFGRVKAWKLEIDGSRTVDEEEINKMKNHTKYVKAMDWAPGGILASSSADGTVQVSKITFVNSCEEDGDEAMDTDADGNDDNAMVHVELMKSLHLTGAVEAVCFVDNGDALCIYERDTSYLAYFDLKDDFKMRTFSLNGSVTGGFDSHVSFVVMHLSLSPNGKYLCAATDTSRNIIIEVKSNRIIRDLYGHKNDGFSQPRIAWSKSGQYIYGNTQEDSSICVWDIASAKLVRRLEGHSGQLRDLFSCRGSDMFVTTSYDKTVKIWLHEM